MLFYYLDSGATLSSHPVGDLVPDLADIDLSWLTIGHCQLPKRPSTLCCLEAIQAYVPEGHQFNFGRWYCARSRQTHCVWYAIPMHCIQTIPNDCKQINTLICTLLRWLPQGLHKASTLVHVHLLGVQCVAGYINGWCVFCQPLTEAESADPRYVSQWVSQSQPEWQFEHHVYLGEAGTITDSLSSLYAHTVSLYVNDNGIKNRMMLYGIS